MQELVETLLAEDVAKYVMAGATDIQGTDAPERVAATLGTLTQHRLQRLCLQYGLPPNASPMDLAIVLIDLGKAKYVMGGVTDIQGPDAPERAAATFALLPAPRLQNLCLRYGLPPNGTAMDLALVLIGLGKAKFLIWRRYRYPRAGRSRAHGCQI